MKYYRYRCLLQKWGAEEVTGPTLRSWVMEEVLYMVVRPLTGKSVTNSLYQAVEQLVKPFVVPEHRPWA